LGKRQDKNKHVENKLKQGRHTNKHSMWERKVWNVKEIFQDSQMLYHFWEFGVLICLAILEWGLKDQTFSKLGLF
jgi:hypothetical protein